MSGVSQATGPRRGSILSVAVAVAVAVAAIVPASTLEAQESRFSLWVGAGGALPLSQPGLDRKVGPGALAAIELAAMPRLSLRAELSGDLQDLNTRSHGLVSGDL